jgi:hypothetical protein
MLLSDLSIIDQARWYQAFDMYVLEFLSSSEFLRDNQRVALATSQVRKYVFQRKEDIPTVAQLDAVPFFP